MAAIRHAYVDTPDGQLHVRTLGNGTPLVLLHWGPATGAQYRHVMPVLADRGFRCLAFDLMGYGRSADRPPQWRMADYAVNISAALAALDVRQCDVLGGHVSAGVALELALDGRVNVARLVLDGSPLLTAEESARLMAKFAHLSPKVRADGGHKTFAWDSVVTFLTEWDPAFRVSDATVPTVHSYMRDLLDANRPPEPSPIVDYDMAPRLEAATLPVLCLSAEREPLRVCHERALARLARGTGHVFAGGHPLHDAARAAEYGDVIAAFLRSG
jgi:pimeloyl-ACP methyl ester carboxylesterase